MRTTAPTNRLSNDLPSRRASPRTTTRSLSPALRGGTPGFAEVDVGADVDDGVAVGLLLLEHPVIAVTAAIRATHASRFG